MELSRHVGTFSISRDIVESNAPILIATIFSKILPLEVSFDFISDSFIYKAWSDKHFREAKEGEPIPQYDAIFRAIEGDEGDYEYEVTFQEIDLNVPLNFSPFPTGECSEETH